MASAMTSPTSSERALIAPTREISSLPEISVDWAFIASTAASTALSTPLLKMTGLAPAATFFKPSLTMTWARTVAVVVPSPATSLVLVATSLTSWAPWFSKMSSSSISRAMVTPSLVMVGDPNFLSNTTYWPLGPSVTLTASASLFTPASSARRASVSNLISLCATTNLLCWLLVLLAKSPLFGTLWGRVPTPKVYSERRYNSNHERVSSQPATEPKPTTEGAGPRGALLRSLRRDQHAHPIPGAEEGGIRILQGSSRERSRNVHKVCPEHRAYRGGAFQSALGA